MGHSIVVTGATRGIGKAIVDRFASDPATDRMILIARHVPSSTGSDKRLLYHACDLSTIEGAQSAISFVQNNAPKVNLLVNNAGNISSAESFPEVSHSAFLDSFSLHAVTPFLLARGLSALFPDGENNLIINIGSVYGSIPDPYAVAYVAAKATVPILTQVLAKELAPRVRVNSIAPGHFDTDMTRAAPEEYVEDIISKTPLKRLGRADEIASLVNFLWSAEASFITGSHFRIDGGFWATTP